MSTHPLIVTAAGALVDELIPLAAEFDLEVDLEPEPAAESWAQAPLVFVGADAAPRLVRAVGRELPHREGVHVVGIDDSDGSDPGLWRVAVELGARSVQLLPAAIERIAGLLRVVSDSRLPRGRLTVVLGSGGGVGGSVVAAMLAATAQPVAGPVILADADPFGGGLELVLGIENAPGLRWPDLRRAALAAPELYGELPLWSDVAVATGAWPGGPSESMIDQLRRSARLVVADAGRDLRLVTAGMPAPVTAVLVTCPDLRGIVAARRIAAQLAAAREPVEAQLILRRGRDAEFSTAEAEAAIGLPVAGSFRFTGAVRRAADRGELGPIRSSLTRLCRRLAAREAA